MLILTEINLYITFNRPRNQFTDLDLGKEVSGSQLVCNQGHIIINYSNYLFISWFIVYAFTCYTALIVAIELASGISAQQPINNMLETILTVIYSKSLFQIHSLYPYAHAYVNSVWKSINVLKTFDLRAEISRYLRK